MLERLKTEVADYLVLELRNELEAQGHNATGKLSESIRVEVINAVDIIFLEGSFLSYGRGVDQGQPVGTYVPIDALIDWMRAKKFNARGKRELSIAYAIQQTILKKGTPTDGDERKKRFMSATLDRTESEVFNRISNIVSDFMQIEFSNIIENAQKEFDRDSIAA
jgi:hypothetical protein